MIQSLGQNRLQGSLSKYSRSDRCYEHRLHDQCQNAQIGAVQHNHRFSFAISLTIDIKFARPLYAFLQIYIEPGKPIFTAQATLCHQYISCRLINSVYWIHILVRTDCMRNALARAHICSGGFAVMCRFDRLL